MTPTAAPQEHAKEPSVKPDPGQLLTPSLIPLARSRTSAAYPRKRSLTACDMCRQKKSKCDNVRPRCGACVRAGNTNCRYRSDDPSADYSSYDPASLTILSKLDVILERIKNSDTPHLDSTASPSSAVPSVRFRVAYFQHCLWDMSLSTIFRWNCVRRYSAISEDEAADFIRRIFYSHNSPQRYNEKPVQVSQKFSLFSDLENLLFTNIYVLSNSFLTNVHPKIPCLDIVATIECVEMYTLVKQANPDISLFALLDDYYHLRSGPHDSPVYQSILSLKGPQSSVIRFETYQHCCINIPLTLIVCGIGLIATSLQSDNIGTFESSVEESRAPSLACLDWAHVPESLPRDRRLLSQLFVEYSQVFTSMFPLCSRPNTLSAVKTQILLSQHKLYMMDPLSAHTHIVRASANMVYFLKEKRMFNGRPTSTADSDNIDDVEGDSLNIDRLFWTCLKLECELRAELSPQVPLSGITQVVPPSLFLRIPELPLPEKHSLELLKTASKYEDKNTWYFFLTEVAVRKVDNRLFDEIYSVDAMRDGLWDTQEFSETNVWKCLVKYSRQYHAIINCLAPNIREFVLLEVNVNQIYAVMKKRAIKAKNKSNDTDQTVMDNLDNFLIDEQILLKAQSEAIMFIKTRILASKIALFRPLVYLILEDKVSSIEFLEVAMVMLPRLKEEAASHDYPNEAPDNALQTSSAYSGKSDINTLDHSSISSNYSGNLIEGELDHLLEFINDPFTNNGPQDEDDFADLLEFDYEKDEQDDDFIRIKDYKAARKRLLQLFIRSLVIMPKINIPKIGVHRHSGLWHYIRGLVMANIFLFMLHKKMKEAVNSLSMDGRVGSSPAATASTFNDIVDILFPKDSIRAALDHSLLICNYWKEESLDCEVYADHIQLCINQL